MADAAWTVSPFSLCAKGVGVFPGIKRPRVLWVGLGGDRTPLAQLQKALDEGVHGIGFARDTRPFKGHLTLGRAKARIDARRLADAITRFGSFESADFQVRAIHLIRSRLKPGGAAYTLLHSEALGGQ
jgi:2'-5' RNA ligase